MSKKKNEESPSQGLPDQIDVDVSEANTVVVTEEGLSWEHLRIGDKIWVAPKNRSRQSKIKQFSIYASKYVEAAIRAGTFGEPNGVDPLIKPAFLPAPDSNLEQIWRDLYRWSIQEPRQFWQVCAEFVGIKWAGNGPIDRLIDDGNSTPDVADASVKRKRFQDERLFSRSLLNFAENIIPEPNDTVILKSVYENGVSEEMSGRQMWNQVASCAKGLKAAGVGNGDRVAGVVSNSSQAIIAMLATTSLGAVWSSCSPDFGVAGISDRLRQVTPTVLFYSKAYRYGGKYFDCQETIDQCLEGLKSVTFAVGIDHGCDTRCASDVGTNEDENTTSARSPNPQDRPGHLSKRENGSEFRRVSWERFQEYYGYYSDELEPQKIDFLPMEFDHPVYIMFSSGTTGAPKCIVHGAGGTILQHKKELILHTDVGAESTLFYFTTCGWMMWNWMVSTLSTGAKLVLYDGSPGYPDLSTLWRLIEKEKITIFGTSPKFIQACINKNIDPSKCANLKYLVTVLSTGAPLLPEHFFWVYAKVKNDVHLASISGGTDIVSCFMLGNPLLPVRVGEIQGPGLGMAIESWDVDGKSCIGEKGELVCVKPFVSMPVSFWNDTDGEIYQKTYFSFYKDQDVWRHGDFIEISQAGGILVHGRSDATLNPGGVRIGTAELYREIDKFENILDSLAVGVDWKGEIQIVLFVKLPFKSLLEEDLSKRIKKEIRKSLTPRHVPAYVIQVDDIPYTRSGKKVEIAVANILRGEAVTNLSAIANPECVGQFERVYRDYFKQK